MRRESVNHVAPWKPIKIVACNSDNVTCDNRVDDDEFQFGDDGEVLVDGIVVVTTLL